MPTSGFCSILEKNFKNSALPESKFGVLWKKSRSNSFFNSKICQDVVGFIDLRQTLGQILKSPVTRQYGYILIN